MSETTPGVHVGGIIPRDPLQPSPLQPQPGDIFRPAYPPRTDPTPKGWECPKCHRVHAPFITHCGHCARKAKT